MRNNSIFYNDPFGDTIQFTKAFENHEGWQKAYDKFAESREGKKFIKDYGVGGKYEHISVVFGVAAKGIAGKGGETGASAVSKKGSLPKINLDGQFSPILGIESILSNKNDYFIQFTISMNPNVDKNGDELYNVKNGFRLLHESQHVMIGTLGLYNPMLRRIPSSKERHTLMRSGKSEYFWSRRFYWWEYNKIWVDDYKKIKGNPSFNIFDGGDYIDKEDTFFD